MNTNLLIALNNIIENPITDLVAHYKGSNRANNMGDALETYVKDIFCQSVHKKNDDIYSDFFSYLGNQNNPPDIIIRNGDAIEVKKIENLTSALALNSSYPKDKLHYDDSRITESCKNCESISWQKKDILYAVGVAPKGINQLKALWFVYGDCYVASPEIYQRFEIIKTDPLGITNLHTRGMWKLENPSIVFGNFATIQLQDNFTFHAIMLKEKYDSFPAADISKLESINNPALIISDRKIKSPNNPTKLLNAKLISYII